MAVSAAQVLIELKRRISFNKFAEAISLLAEHNTQDVKDLIKNDSQILIDLIKAKDRMRSLWNMRDVHAPFSLNIQWLSHELFSDTIELLGSFSSIDVLFELLLNYGADLNANIRDQRAPLNLAVEVGDAELVALLLGHGARINAAFGFTPVHQAAEAGHADIVDLLFKKVNSDARRCLTLIVINRSPLHLAAEAGRAKVVSKLLEQPGIDSNIKNWDEKTPLDLAREKGHAEVIEILESHHVMATPNVTSVSSGSLVSFFPTPSPNLISGSAVPHSDPSSVEPIQNNGFSLAGRKLNSRRATT